VVTYLAREHEVPSCPGTFTAKAGFDLRKPFEIGIASSPLRVSARLPRPELLSLQMDSFEVLLDENGWWNRLTEEDRTGAVTALQSVARSKAMNSGLLKKPGGAPRSGAGARGTQRGGGGIRRAPLVSPSRISGTGGLNDGYEAGLCVGLLFR